MPIKVTCSCGKTLSVPESMAGKRGKCPGCGNVLTVPELTAVAKPAEEEEQPRRVYKPPDFSFTPLILVIVLIVVVVGIAVGFYLRKESSPESVYDRAREHVIKGDFYTAKQELKALIAEEPKNPKPHVALGNVLMEDGKLPEALAEYDKALELDPDSAEALERKGILYLRQNEVAKARQILKELKKKDEKLAQTLQNEIEMLVPSEADMQKEADKTNVESPQNP